MPEIYQSLGVRPVINAASTYTKLGGSIMAPHVAQAMADAAAAFVALPELQTAVGKRLAELTRNEAAYVSNGAAAGLALATAACMTGDDLALMSRLPNDTTGMKNEVIVHRAHRNAYDIAIRQVGACLVEIGNTETFAWQLDAAFSERTAAVAYFAGSGYARTRTLPLPEVIAHAHARGVPVIVDAAAQIPPVSNLWHFTTELGADLAIFSGGKGLRGPQNSGLVVGRADLIRAIALNGPPVQRVGRAMKVSKEAMVGLLIAVEHYLATDHDAELAVWNAVVDHWLRAWSPAAPSGIGVTRLESGESGEAVPRIILSFGPPAAIDRDAFVAMLAAVDPVIEVVLYQPAGVAISPHLLQSGEAEIVERRVETLLRRLSKD
jgi:uncharacterized pyridoxal phosphate-dependent enzyme